VDIFGHLFASALPQSPMQIPAYLRELNPAQREAAMTIHGPLLVLAGAGSGKTRTLVLRIAHLIRSGIAPRQILALTFTNKAAAEMRERAAHVVGREARGVTLATFHSLGARILREHGARVGLPDGFSIYATAEQLGLIRHIISEEVHVVATAGEDRYDLKRVLAEISRWKNRMLPPREAIAEVATGTTRGNRSDDYAVLAAAAYERYQEALRAAGACDFDDLLLLAVALLRDDAEIRERLWKRWHYLLVDEYQDTNGAQLELARLLAGPRQNLCVVGDDDQSIYAWRGADLRNILEFERHFPGARVVILEQNYRSTQRILDAANAVIAHNTARKPKRMTTRNGLGPKLDYWEFGTGGAASAEEEEAEMVAREISVRRFAGKLAWNDFAVLYRTNHQSRVLEEALRALNIPYRVVGGTSYFDRKEIADAVAYLRAVANPRDEVSLRRIINYPARGIGRTTLLRLIEDARSWGRTLWETLGHGGEVAGVSGAQAEAVQHFAASLVAARAELQKLELDVPPRPGVASPLEAWARGFLAGTGLEEAIRQENAAARAAEIRTDNLRDFVSSIGAYERRVWDEEPLPDEEADWHPPSLLRFLERISLFNELDAANGADAVPDQVTLLTLHSAKGLEFSHVFLVGMEEDILPHARTVAEVAEATSADPLAEERRLFYVGITRARHRLTLSGCRTRRRGGEAYPRQPSRFLQEIPPELIERRSPGAASSLTDDDREQLRENFFSQMREMLGS
jgi:DNA helicase II / ATP-dependent DNA helicase PcrA